ncbi:four helix bundle protein [Desertibacillus haloalkaliphilus]|uniref:four helix bundle protein n=1 Tax=Desertibacillus haloalkaliphilus TaxID=1328930 RepID=UPI001FE53860|nr:four helix bundle protein [Desertibacillus haloalkaliphilus]
MDRNTNKLIVWKKAHILVLKVYDITSSFPRDEQFGLTSQLRRAAVSVPSNIVEGKARGSLEEVKYQLLLARDLKYIDGRVSRINKSSERSRQYAKWIVGVIGK